MPSSALRTDTVEMEALEDKALDKLRELKALGRLPKPIGTPTPPMQTLAPALRRFLDGWSGIVQRNVDAAPEIAIAKERALLAIDRERKESLRWHLKACGVPARFVDEVEELGVDGIRSHPIAGPAVRALDGFLRGPKDFAFVFGGFGSGKTLAASMVFLQRTRKTSTSYHPLADVLEHDVYDSAGSFFTHARDVSWCRPYTDEGTTYMRRCCRASLLVLDDIGAESNPDEGGRLLEKVQGIIDARYSERLKTVITTNLSTEAFVERYGGRVASRLAQEALSISSGNVDLRRQR